jgi:hypothetical protein
MSKVHVHVWHNNEGQIVAIGRPGKGPEYTAVPISDRGHSILSTDIDETEVQKLHQTHMIDTHNRALVKRQS